MLIFSAQMVLTPAMMTTHHRHTFVVPEGAKRLVIDFSYSPKYETNTQRLYPEAVALLTKAYGECPVSEEGVEFVHTMAQRVSQRASNLITLSLDAPDGFAGASHRQEDPIRVTLDAKEATLGYLPREIVPGTWAMWLHMHAVASPNVSCSLQVSVEMEGISGEIPLTRDIAEYAPKGVDA